MVPLRSVKMGAAFVLLAAAVPAAVEAQGPAARVTYPDLAAQIYIEENSAALFDRVGAPLLAELTKSGAPRVVAAAGDAIIPALRSDRTSIAVMPRQRLNRLSDEAPPGPAVMSAETGVRTCIAIGVAAGGPVESLGDMALLRLAGDDGRVSVLMAPEPGLRHLFEAVLAHYGFRSGIGVVESELGVGLQAVASGDAAAMVFSIAPEGSISDVVEPALAERMRFVPVGAAIRDALSGSQIAESRYLAAGSFYSPFADLVPTVCDDIVLAAAAESSFDLAAFRMPRNESRLKPSTVLEKSQRTVDDLMARTARAVQTLWSLL